MNDKLESIFLSRTMKTGRGRAMILGQLIRAEEEALHALSSVRNLAVQLEYDVETFRRNRRLNTLRTLAGPFEPVDTSHAADFSPCSSLHLQAMAESLTSRLYRLASLVRSSDPALAAVLRGLNASSAGSLAFCRRVSRRSSATSCQHDARLADARLEVQRNLNQTRAQMIRHAVKEDLLPLEPGQGILWRCYALLISSTRPAKRRRFSSRRIAVNGLSR